MGKRVLTTGGAGFVDSHLADGWREAGCEVRALDCLAEQVHLPGIRRPDDLSSDACSA